MSFYEATARVRAKKLVDPGTFFELAGPETKSTSPHLPELGEAISFDDGVVTAFGKIGDRPVFVISQEGRFIGGSVGEVSGAKMVGAFTLALDIYEKGEEPAVIISFDTGGVRLHEANAGLLAHAEVMELIQKCRGKVPVISLVGSKVGCFGGMGFVAVATDLIIMSDLGRIGLTGPEVIEEVMGKKEFDASDRSLIYRTTGGKHKYIMNDCAYLVEDSFEGFRNCLIDVMKMPYEKIASYRTIGSHDLVMEQLELIKLAANVKDATDIWEHFGNKNVNDIPDMSYEEFMESAKTRKGASHVIYRKG